MHSDLHHLKDLVKEKSNLTDVSSFHKAINVIFHDIEAKYYDTIHAEMWESLQPIYDSFFQNFDFSKYSKLKVLDIGCGTGLSTQMLINTPINQHISEVFLLDTSKVMLEKAKSRLDNGKIKYHLFHGELAELEEENFDFILISSVLHHIPNLQGFFDEINKKLKIGGLLFHIHDPNGDAIKNELYLSRVATLKAEMVNRNKRIDVRLINKLKRIINGKNPDYIAEVNEILIKKGIVHMPLADYEIWSVTDIHVEDLPYSTNNGISLKTLTTQLKGYKLREVKAYSFYGLMYSKLPKKFKSKELMLFNKDDMNGRNISCLWERETNT